MWDWTNQIQWILSETAERYVSLYSWYYMSPTVHKILIHTKSLIEAQDLPIGYYSEEPPESLNKIVRYARLHKSMKKIEN